MTENAVTLRVTVDVDDSALRDIEERLRLMNFSLGIGRATVEDVERRARAQDDGVHAAQHDDAAQSVEVWRHVKTGGEYGGRVLTPLQCSGARHLETVRWCVYYSRDTGDAYVRPLDEFMDGRFEPVNEGARAAQLAWRAEHDNAVETRAKLVYECWSELKGFVPWVEGGNSDMQTEARRTARGELSTAYRLLNPEVA